MPVGKITKIVHLNLQSSASTESSPQSKGYGYLKGGDDETPLHFDAKAVSGYGFDDLQVGQEVDFVKDPKLPVAKSVSIPGDILSPPVPQVDLA
ncbi:MAG: cold shock domain-containing protein [Planctomycetales bacterium]